MAGTRGKGSRSRAGHNSGHNISHHATTVATDFPDTDSPTTESPATDSPAIESLDTDLSESHAAKDSETQTEIMAHLFKIREVGGTYLRKNAPTNNAEKRVIHIDGLNYLEVEVPRSITKEYKGSFSGKKTEWHLLDKNLVEHLYKKFQDLYQYEDGGNLEWARHVWEEKSKALCRQTWNQVRKQCKKNSNSTNPADWKPFRPCFVHQDDWEGIIESWIDPRWQKLSENGSKNRKRVFAEDGGESVVSHTGGSVNFAIHLRRMVLKKENELGHTPNKLNFFAKMHKKDKGKGEWCAEKAEKVAKKYEGKMKEKVQLDGIEQHSEIPFDPKVWLEVTGVSKNKQVYGQCQNAEFDSLIGQVATSGHSKRTLPQTITPMNIEEQIEQEVTTRVASHVDSLRVEVEEKMQTEMNAKEERMRVEMEEKMRQMLENYHPS